MGGDFFENSASEVQRSADLAGRERPWIIFAPQKAWIENERRLLEVGVTPDAKKCLIVLGEEGYFFPQDLQLCLLGMTFIAISYKSFRYG